MRQLTEENKIAFLASLEAGKTVTEACKRAGISRRSAYYWKEEDESFSDLWDEKQALGSEMYEDELRDRALDRTDPHSSRLLMFLLKKLNPEFRENAKTEQTIKVEGTRAYDFSPGEQATAIEILRNAVQTKAKEE